MEPFVSPVPVPFRMYVQRRIEFHPQIAEELSGNLDNRSYLTTPAVMRSRVLHRDMSVV